MKGQKPSIKQVTGDGEGEGGEESEEESATMERKA